MNNNFLKTVFSSCLGTLLALGAVVGVFVLLLIAIGSSGDKKEIANGSILKIKLSPELQLPEKTNNVESEGSFSFKKTTAVGLNDAIKTLEIAKTDNRIKGILLECEGLTTPQATTTAFRRALEDFKTSGKFIIANGKFYMQKDYYVASVADKILMHPMGIVDFRGYGSQITYFKNMLDRLDIKVQVYYAGQFKSATEPFRYDKMSDQNRVQVKEYLGELYDIFIQKISTSRNIPTADLRNYANNLMIKSADDAVNYRLIDQKGYEEDVLIALREKAGLTEKDKIKYVSLGEYYGDVKEKFEEDSDAGIAVVYCEGEITDGKAAAGVITGDKYSEILRKLRKDDDIKAIVLRVNSPGGSAMASESILNEVNLCKKAGKKVVVSMGDYAASGGYFIACSADTIFAEPNTITGSIGVFSIIPSFEKTMKNKIGITFDTVNIGKYSNAFSVVKDFSTEESAFLQQNTDRIYETFLRVVSEGRKKTRDEIHAIAQGRVWTGQKGLQIGLVDKIGNLNDAIACAARMAGIEKKNVREFPATKEPFEQFMNDLLDKDDNEAAIRKSLLKSELGEYYTIYNRLQKIQAMRAPQMRMMFDMEVK
jgi:protease IV